MQAVVDALFQDSPGATLFHYTSYAAALEIVRGHSLWASEIRYLNDSSELRNALNIIGWAAIKRAPKHSGDEAQMLRDFVRWCEGAASSDRCVFVASLTQHGNLLSQWRAYSGDAGHGVSLTFDPQSLEALAVQQGFRLGRCIYERVEQERLAEIVVDHLLEQFAQFDWQTNKPAGHESVQFYPLFDAQFQDVLQLAALLKHEAFFEEAEWRLVSDVVPSGLVKNAHFRSAKSCIVPYLVLDLNTQDVGLEVIRGAIIGPCANPNLAMHSMQMVMSRHLKNGVSLVNPMVPLRGSV